MADSDSDTGSSSSEVSRPIRRSKQIVRKHSRTSSTSSVDRAKEEIICPMCIGVFNVPRSLTCLHSYCEKCIESLLETSANKTAIGCPECRAITNIPEDGIDGLPINFKLQRFVEILSSEERLDILFRSATQKQAKAASIPEVTKANLTCILHENKEMEYYCEQCSLLICGKCMLEKHRMHQGVLYATEAIPKRLAVLKQSLVPVETALGDSKAFIESLDASVAEIKTEAKEAAKTVTNYFENMERLLQERKTSFLEEISNESCKKEKNAITNQQTIQTAMDELQKCVDDVDNIEENRGSDIAVLLEEEGIKARIEHHKSQLEVVIANIKIQGSLNFKSPFHPDTYFEDLCKTVGEHPYQRASLFTVLENDDEYVDMSPLHLTSIRPRAQSGVQRTSSESLPSTDSSSAHEQASSRYSLPIIPRSMPPLGQTRERFSGFYENEDATEFEDVITPSMVINSRQLLGSSPQLGSVYPNGVCVGKPDSLIVTDSRSGILRILTPTGKCLDSVVIQESKGEFSLFEPTAVTTSEEGSIYLIIRGPSSKIHKYSSSGKYLMKLKGSSQLGNPTGLTVLPNGNLLVSDSQKGCVHLYDSSSGKLRGKLDISEIYHPHSPSDITRDHRGNLIMTDYGYHCVWVYTSNGRYMTRFGKKGTKPGELLEPYSVATDMNGNIFVSECGNHRISVFNTSGKFVCCFGKKGSEPGMFLYPRHLCVDSQGRLVVADEQNHRLQIFDIKEHISCFI